MVCAKELSTTVPKKQKKLIDYFTRKAKGYYSKENENLALDFGIEKVGMQRPSRKLDKPPCNPATDYDQVMLANG